MQVFPFPADVLMAVTYGVVGKHQSCCWPAPCRILPEWEQLIVGEALCRKDLFNKGLTYSALIIVPAPVKGSDLFSSFIFAF